MLDLRAWRDIDGSEPFIDWMFSLDDRARARVQTVLARMANGNLGDTKSVGDSVVEHRIDWGPGYRVYFGRDGAVLVVLLAGGTKRGQARDIATAKQRWARYRAEPR